MFIACLFSSATWMSVSTRNHAMQAESTGTSGIGSVRDFWPEFRCRGRGLGMHAAGRTRTFCIVPRVPTPRERMETALSRLVGLRMWAAHRAADMLTLQFGEQCATVTLYGDRRMVGTYALHLQCPWRWIDPSGQQMADKAAWGQMASIASRGHVPTGVTADDDGRFHLSFADGSTLHVEPDEGVEPREHWRMFEPARETSHFVVTDTGVRE